MHFYMRDQEDFEQPGARPVVLLPKIVIGSYRSPQGAEFGGAYILSPISLRLIVGPPLKMCFSSVLYDVGPASVKAFLMMLQQSIAIPV